MANKERTQESTQPPKIREHFGKEKLEVLLSEWLRDAVATRPDLLINKHRKKSTESA